MNRYAVHVGSDYIGNHPLIGRPLNPPLMGIEQANIGRQLTLMPLGSHRLRIFVRHMVIVHGHGHDHQQIQTNKQRKHKIPVRRQNLRLSQTDRPHKQKAGRSRPQKTPWKLDHRHDILKQLIVQQCQTRKIPRCHVGEHTSRHKQIQQIAVLACPFPLPLTQKSQQPDSHTAKQCQSQRKILLVVETDALRKIGRIDRLFEITAPPQHFRAQLFPKIIVQKRHKIPQIQQQRHTGRPADLFVSFFLKNSHTKTQSRDHTENRHKSRA